MVFSDKRSNICRKAGQIKAKVNKVSSVRVKQIHVHLENGHCQKGDAPPHPTRCSLHLGVNKSLLAVIQELMQDFQPGHVSQIVPGCSLARQDGADLCSLVWMGRSGN